MATTTVIVDFHARPGQRDSLTTFLGQALDKTLQNPACWKAELIVDQDDADRFVMVQQWSTAQAHKDYVVGLMQNPKMQEAFGLMTRPPKTRYYDDHSMGGGRWGGPGHLELSTLDVDATSAFLTEVFGWRFSQWMEGYTGWIAPGTLYGGLRPKMDEEAAPQAVPYLVVDDIDARLEAVQAAGGQVTVPIQTVPNAGRFFWFIAPGGLQLAVWESVTPG